MKVAEIQDRSRGHDLPMVTRILGLGFLGLVLAINAAAAGWPKVQPASEA
jgi:hypothetical protein